MYLKVNKAILKVPLNRKDRKVPVELEPTTYKCKYDRHSAIGVKQSF